MSNRVIERIGNKVIIEHECEPKDFKLQMWGSPVDMQSYKCTVCCREIKVNEMIKLKEEYELKNK